MRWLKQFNTIVTVEPLTFLYYFAFAIGLVAWQQTLYIKLCHQEGYNVTLCSNATWEEQHPNLQKQTSYWMIYTNTAVLIPLLFCLTLLTDYSNRNSLRLAIALPLIGGVLTTGWTVLQLVYLDWDPFLLLISALGWGVTGHFPTVTMAVTTYIIKDPDVKNLGLRLAVLEGTQVLASAIGTIVAGPIIDMQGGNGLINAWIVCAVIEAFAIADMFLRLKALPPPDYAEVANRRSSLKRYFTLDPFKTYFKALFRKRNNSKRLHLHTVVITTMIGYLSFAGTTNILFLYITKQYGRSNTEYSIYQGLNCISSLIGNTLFVYFFTTYYKVSDIGFTVVGLVSSTISYTLLGYASQPVPYWLAIVFRIFSSYTWIGGRLYITHKLEKEEHTAGMGYYATVQCITTLLASAIFNSLYPLTLDLWPGLCFALAGLLTVLAVPALTFVKWNDIRQGTDN